MLITSPLTRGSWHRSIHTLTARGTSGPVIRQGSMVITDRPMRHGNLDRRPRHELATRQVKILITPGSMEIVLMKAAGACRKRDKGTGRPLRQRGGRGRYFGGASRGAGPLKSCNLVVLPKGFKYRYPDHRFLEIACSSGFTHRRRTLQVSNQWYLTHPPTLGIKRRPAYAAHAYHAECWGAEPGCCSPS